MTRKGLSLGIVVTALVLGVPATGQTLVDGDTIDLKGTIFRLHGIDAPELRQVWAMAARS